ncbi:unknown protein [Microcystis aeruginosa NIES-843]|uniref:Uncharacterized protein n=1 Tax=Microcystis aeruginosa (strain NIES-843 / IAM M-2473) TaxID=449447 RepID=B0JW68_MICAN|nr:unknown protein [Microcystis aeruginosa NIES-843]
MNIAFLVNVNYNQIWHRLPTPQPKVSASQTLLTIEMANSPQICLNRSLGKQLT